MRDHRNQIDEEKQKESGKENDLVFPSAVGTAIDPSNILNRFRKVLENAGLRKIRFHDLRHTAATLMLNHGADILVASTSLGHAQPSKTLDVYRYLLDSGQIEIAEEIEEYVLSEICI